MRATHFACDPLTLVWLVLLALTPGESFALVLKVEPESIEALGNNYKIDHTAETPPKCINSFYPDHDFFRSYSFYPDYEFLCSYSIGA